MREGTCLKVLYMKADTESINKLSYMVNDNLKLHLKCSNTSTVTETSAEYKAPVHVQTDNGYF